MIYWHQRHKRNRGNQNKQRQHWVTFHVHNWRNSEWRAAPFELIYFQAGNGRKPKSGRRHKPLDRLMTSVEETMRYIEFKDLIQNELIKYPSGLTWSELKNNLNLPYSRPCQTWIKQLEQEIGLARSRETRSAYIWKIPSQKE